MKVLLSVCLAATCLVSTLAFGAETPAEMAKTKNCMACHGIDHKIVGPAFKDIAAKYAGQPDAAAQLTQKVLKGSSGVWGPVPAPASSLVTEAEARTLVNWVLDPNYSPVRDTAIAAEGTGKALPDKQAGSPSVLGSVIEALPGAIASYNLNKAGADLKTMNAQAQRNAAIAAQRQAQAAGNARNQQARNTYGDTSSPQSNYQAPSPAYQPQQQNNQQPSTGYAQTRNSDSPANLGTGQACSRDSDCGSRACYPGPDGDSQSYCVDRSLNCALRGYDGAKYGARMSVNGTTMVCANPGGGRARFVVDNQNGGNQVSGNPQQSNRRSGSPRYKARTNVDASSSIVSLTVTNYENEVIVCEARSNYDNRRFNVPASSDGGTILNSPAQSTVCYWISP